MQNKRFNPFPFGTKHKEIPLADLVDGLEETSVVQLKDADAYYFQLLENEGIILNEAQVQAVRHIDGPLLTLAGAGSGKTSVLVCRTGYLISVHQVPAENILLVTFTKKAADEMKARITALPGLTRTAASHVQARTFHSFFLFLLKRMGYDHGILSSERYKQVIVTQLLRTLGLEDSFQAETLLSLLSFYKLNLVSLEDIPEKTKSEKEMKRLFKAYEAWKKERHQLDFDDILLEAYDLLRKSPALLKSLQDRFRYIMVDEFQDTNLLQYELIKLLAKTHQNLFVVGDDDQTIYSFNGARHDIILNFEHQFFNVKRVVLDINYRSHHSIVGLGNQVIKHNVKRTPKRLKSTRPSSMVPQFSRPSTVDEEAEQIVQVIQERVEGGTISFGDIAILFRTANNSRAIFEQMTLQGIPFVDYSVGNPVFYEQWPVKSLLSYLRLALNPRNMEALEDVLPTLFVNRNLGMNQIRKQENLKEKKYPLIHLTSLPNLKTFQIEQIKSRIQVIKNLKDLKPETAINKLRKDFYDRYLNMDKHDQPTLVKESVKESLDELEASAKRFKTVASFLEFVDGMIEKHEEMKKLKMNTSSDVVHLMTVHRAKGLEFPIVYLIGASEGILPHSTAMEVSKLEDRVTSDSHAEKGRTAMEEERRLCYVAITRAKDELYISSPAFYRGKKVGVSRFLLEAFGNKEIHPDKEKDKSSRNTSSESSSSNTSAYQISVLAWLCSSDHCHAWQRIVTSEEAEHELKTCPLCHSPMEKGEKEVAAQVT